MSELDRLGASYEAHHRERRAGGEFIFVPERIPLFVAAVGGPGRTVLDLGCRSGAVTSHFLAGNDVTGLDVDPEALAVAAERGITPVRASAEEPAAVRRRQPSTSSSPGSCSSTSATRTRSSARRCGS